MKKNVGMLFLLVLAATSAFGQESTGNLQGRVLDAQRAAIAGAEVSISGPSLQGTRTLLTDGRGYFNALAIPVGQFTVKISHSVFRGITFENVPVRLGKTSSLGDILLVQKIQDAREIVVSAEKPVIDTISTAQGSNIESRMFESLPTARNFRSIIALTAQANSSFYGDEVNISGSTGLENAYYIDGINVTDPMRGATSSNLPYNFVKEIEIKIGGYEAEYGRALGGIVNVITHSGSNEFRGQVFGFFNNRGLAGTERQGRVLENVGNFATYDFGLSLGGPIVRDKLWFFAAYNPNFEDKDVEIPGLGFRTDRKRTHLFAGKLTWQISTKTNAEATLLGDPSRRDRIGTTYTGQIPVPSLVLNPDPWMGNIKQGGISLALNVRHIVNEKIFLEASLFHSSRDEDDVPATARGRSEPFYYDFLEGVLSGGYGRTWKDHTNRVGGKIKATFFFGNHTLKAGFEYEDNSDQQVFENMAGADGRTPSVVFHLADAFWFATWSQRHLKVHNRIPSVFFQDSWLVNERFRLNAGLRWEGQFLIGSDGKIAQRITDEWQPRLGFTYQVGEIGSQKIFGSYGRFYEQLPMMLSAFNHATATYYELYFDHNPLLDWSGAERFDLASSITPEVKGLKGQSFDEFTLGYERRIGNDFKIGIRGIYRNLNNVIEDAVDLASGIVVIGNPRQGALADLPKFTRTYMGLEVSIEKAFRRGVNFSASYTLSRNYGNYTGLFDSDSGWPNPNMGTFDLVEQVHNSTGLLPNDRTHVFKLFGSYAFPFGLSLGTFFSLQSGTPLNNFGAATTWPNHVIFLSQRGTAGRTPTLWDWNIRLAYDLGTVLKTKFHPRLFADIFHVFSRRSAVLQDQVRYFAVDENGAQTSPNDFYLTPIAYQPPMMARLGFELKF
jgi:hypothetical protein